MSQTSIGIVTKIVVQLRNWNNQTRQDGIIIKSEILQILKIKNEILYVTNIKIFQIQSSIHESDSKIYEVVIF